MPVAPLTNLKRDFMTDVVISCEGKEFPAHRAVLGSKISFKFIYQCLS
jgi:hypothetical protein